MGDFNNWNKTSHPLSPRWDSSGIWEGFIANVILGIGEVDMSTKVVFAESGNTRVLGQQGFFNNFDVKLSCRKEIIEIKVSRSI